MFDEQRTEPPTPNRRDEARKEGQVARSRDLSVALGLIGAFGAMSWLGPWLVRSTADMTRGFLGELTADPGAVSVTAKEESRLA